MPSIKYIALIATLACAGALAQDRPPKVGETRDPPKEAPQDKGGQDKDRQDKEKDRQDKPEQAEPAKANPTGDERKKKPPVKRRAVHQIVDGMPRPAPPLSYGPVLTPPLRSPLPAIPSSSPVPIGSCMGGSCTDTSGTRYNGGVGTTLLSPSGRLCNNNGATVSCF